LTTDLERPVSTTLSGQPAAGPRYVFDNDSAHAPDQHRCLADLLDPITTARLAATGVTDGWHCLDVGAGGGSVAVWLAGQVAPSGRVLATDIKPVRIPAAPGLRVARHDIVRDPLPEAGYDLIHARLVLRHLPGRSAALGKLVRALRPGGWLQVDEFDTSYGPPLLMPDAAAQELYGTFVAARLRLMERAGVDPTWGQHAPAAMRRAGLVGVDPQVRLQVWRAGSPGTRLLAHSTRHLRDAFVAEGMTDQQLADVRALLADPAFAAVSCAIYSVQGRRP